MLALQSDLRIFFFAQNLRVGVPWGTRNRLVWQKNKNNAVFLQKRVTSIDLFEGHFFATAPVLGPDRKS